MTARERAALWGAFVAHADQARACGRNAFLAMKHVPVCFDEVQEWATWGFHQASLALDAYEALKEADTLETLDEMGYDAECVIRQQWEAKRCGTCRWWGSDPRTTAIERGCSNDHSSCSYVSAVWPADHGCPHWRGKDGVA